MLYSKSRSSELWPDESCPIWLSARLFVIAWPSKSKIICIQIVLSLTSRISSSNTMMKLNVSKAQMQNDIDSQLKIIIIILTTYSLKVILLWYSFMVPSENFLPDKMIKLVQCQSSFSHYQSRRSFLFDREGNCYWYWESHSNIFV